MFSEWTGKIRSTMIDESKDRSLGVKLTQDGRRFAVTAGKCWSSRSTKPETQDGSIVFSSDQNGTNPKFTDFARSANVLIMHLAIAASATSPLHAAPAVVGRIAQDAGVGRLIVSHIRQFDLDDAVADLEKLYTGPLTIGADLQCTPIAR
jgi:ribonuclease BN (tRNA processing enzyme)